MSDPQSFLGDITTTFVGDVICLTKYQIDGSENKGGALWVRKPNTGRNPNIIGDELIQIKIPFELFSQQKEKQDSGDIKIPGHFEIHASVDMGAGKKGALTALSMKPYKPDLPTADDVAAKPESNDVAAKPESNDVAAKPEPKNQANQQTGAANKLT